MEIDKNEHVMVFEDMRPAKLRRTNNANTITKALEKDAMLNYQAFCDVSEQIFRETGRMSQDRQIEQGDLRQTIELYQRCRCQVK